MEQQTLENILLEGSHAGATKHFNPVAARTEPDCHILQPLYLSRQINHIHGEEPNND